ncbi:MAG TPA: hypothetical protein VGR57_11100 [Ktedonobacterales bacterium]|nr:hypothetical protein [Ktedonobacterales bacterium]
MSGHDDNTNGGSPSALKARLMEAPNEPPARAGATNGQSTFHKWTSSSDAGRLLDVRDSRLHRPAQNPTQPEPVAALSADRHHTDGSKDGATDDAEARQTLRDSGNPIVKAWAVTAQQAKSVASRLSTKNQTPYAFAGLALLLGYAWLLAGVDKLLLGNFPTQLTQILTSTLDGGKLPGFLSGFLRATVLPNSAVFGVLAESGETLAGLGLIAASMALLFAPPLERRMAPPVAQWIARLRVLLVALGLLAAVGTVFLGATYYLLDGAPFQGFMPSVAFGGALDPGLLLALGSLALLVAAIPAHAQHRHRLRLLAAQLVHRDENHGKSTDERQDGMARSTQRVDRRGSGATSAPAER